MNLIILINLMIIISQQLNVDTVNINNKTEELKIEGFNHIDSLDYSGYFQYENNHTLHYFQVQNKDNNDIKTVIRIYNSSGNLIKDIYLDQDQEKGKISIVGLENNEFILIKNVFNFGYKRSLTCLFLDFQGQKTRGDEFVLQSFTSDHKSQENNNIYAKKGKQLIYIVTTIYEEVSVSRQRGLLVQTVQIGNKPYFKLVQSKVFYQEQSLLQNGIILQMSYNDQIKISVADDYNVFSLVLEKESDLQQKQLQIDESDILYWDYTQNYKINQIDLISQSEDGYIETVFLWHQEDQLRIAYLDKNGQYKCANTFLYGHSFQGQIQSGRIYENLIFAKVNMDGQDYVMFFDAMQCIFYQNSSISLYFGYNYQKFSIAALNFDIKNQDKQLFILNQQSYQKEENFSSFQSYQLEIDFRILSPYFEDYLQVYQANYFASPFTFYQFQENKNQTDQIQNLIGNGDISYNKNKFSQGHAEKLINDVYVLPMFLSKYALKFITYNATSKEYTYFQEATLENTYVSLCSTNIEGEFAYVKTVDKKLYLRLVTLLGISTRKTSEYFLIFERGNFDKVYPSSIQRGDKYIYIQLYVFGRKTDLYQIYFDLQNEVEIKKENITVQKYEGEKNFNPNLQNLFQVYDDDSSISFAYDNERKNLYTYKFEKGILFEGFPKIEKFEIMEKFEDQEIFASKPKIHSDGYFSTTVIGSVKKQQYIVMTFGKEGEIICSQFVDFNQEKKNLEVQHDFQLINDDLSLFFLPNFQFRNQYSDFMVMVNPKTCLVQQELIKQTGLLYGGQFIIQEEKQISIQLLGKNPNNQRIEIHKYNLSIEALIEVYNKTDFKNLQIQKNYDFYQIFQTQNYTQQLGIPQNNLLLSEKFNEYVNLRSLETVMLLLNENVTSFKQNYYLQVMENDTIISQRKIIFYPRQNQQTICKTNQDHEFMFAERIISKNNILQIQVQFEDIQFNLTRGLNQIVDSIIIDKIGNEYTRILAKLGKNSIYLGTQVRQNSKVGLLVIQVDISEKDYFSVKNKQIYYLGENQNNFGSIEKQFYMQAYNDDSAFIIVRSEKKQFYLKIQQNDDWNNLRFQEYQVNGYNLLSVPDQNLAQDKFGPDELTFMAYTQSNYLGVQSLKKNGQLQCSKYYFEQNEITGIQVKVINEYLVLVLVKINGRYRNIFFNPYHCEMYQEQNYMLQFVDDVYGVVQFYDQDGEIYVDQYQYNYIEDDIDAFYIQRVSFGSLSYLQTLLEQNYGDLDPLTWKNPLSEVKYDIEFLDELKNQMLGKFGQISDNYQQIETNRYVISGNGNTVQIYQNDKQFANVLIYEQDGETQKLFQILNPNFYAYSISDSQNNDELIFITAANSDGNLYTFYFGYDGKYQPVPLLPNKDQKESLLNPTSKKGKNLIYILAPYKDQSNGYQYDYMVFVIDANVTSHIEVKETHLLKSTVQLSVGSLQVLQVYDDDKAVVILFFKNQYLTYKFDENGKLVDGMPIFRVLDHDDGFIEDQIICSQAKLHSDNSTSSVVQWQRKTQKLKILNFKKNGEIMDWNVYDLSDYQQQRYKYLTEITFEMINDYILWIKVGFFNQYDHFRDVIFFGNPNDCTIDFGQMYRSTVFVGQVAPHITKSGEYVIFHIGKSIYQYDSLQVLKLNFKDLSELEKINRQYAFKNNDNNENSNEQDGEV